MDHSKQNDGFNRGIAFRPFVMVIICILLQNLFAHPAAAQEYSKNNKRYYKAYYKKQSSWYSNACNRLEQKRHHQSNIKVHAKSKPRSTAETMPSPVLAKATTPKPAPKPEVKPEIKPTATPAPLTPKVEQISPEKLVALHKKEDEVLASNDLPKPTSKEQEKVRKIVADKLASKTNIYPLNLPPLYFTFAEDEFSVVDMEPFLIAAEYALQGRTVLIEGHTDNKGDDTYNMNLSIKRVQKIRQLMLDMGVPDDRISIVGYGEQIKTNNNNTTKGRELNRRVDFTIF